MISASGYDRGIYIDDNLILQEISKISYHHIDNNTIYAYGYLDQKTILFKYNLLSQQFVKIDSNYSVPSHVFANNEWIVYSYFHDNLVEVYDLEFNLVQRFEFTKIHQTIIDQDGTFYSCAWEDNCVLIYDLMGIKKIIPLLANTKPRHLLIHENKLYINCEQSNELIIYDLKQNSYQTHSYGVEKARAAAIKLYRNLLYITIRDQDYLVLFDLKKNQITQKIKIRANTRDITFDNGILYLASMDANKIYILEGEKIIDVQELPQITCLQSFS